MAVSSIEAKMMAPFLILMAIVVAVDGVLPAKSNCPTCCNWEKCCKFTTCGSCDLHCDLICPPCPNVTRIPEPNSRNRAEKESHDLLVGKLISQGSVRSKVLGEGARSQGEISNQIEEVTGKEIAESARQHVQPEDELQVGSLIEEYEKPPSDKTIHIRTQGRFRDVKRVSGKVLDENVQTGRYVDDPVQVLAELKARGEIIETVKAEIVAGDATDLNVVNLKEGTDVNDGPSIMERQLAVEIGTGPMIDRPREEKSVKCHMNGKGEDPKEITCKPGIKFCNYIDRNGIVTRNCGSGVGKWPRVRCIRTNWFTSCLCEGNNCNAGCTWDNCKRIAISRSIDSVPDKTILNCNANCKAKEEVANQTIKAQDIEKLTRQGVCDIKPCCCGDCYPCPYERIPELQKIIEEETRQNCCGHGCCECSQCG